MKKSYLINRDMYKNIKRMDHRQMERFLEDVYKEGVKDGKAAVPGVDISEIEKAIKGTRGIGEKKAADIMREIERKFGEEDVNEKRNGI